MITFARFNELFIWITAAIANFIFLEMYLVNNLYLCSIYFAISFPFVENILESRIQTTLWNVIYLFEVYLHEFKLSHFIG